MKKTTLMIADDHALFTDGIRMLLQDEPGIAILDAANDGKELLELLNSLQPDIILLDINMPRINGLEALKKISMLYPAIRVIMLSTYNDPNLVQKAQESGAKGYLLKNTTRQELLECVSIVMCGGTCFPDRQQQEPQPSFPGEDPFLKQYQLTRREIEVLQHIKQGNTNQQISEKLYLSIYTVETHRKNIMHKLSLNSPAALMKFIMQHNI